MTNVRKSFIDKFILTIINFKFLSIMENKLFLASDTPLLQDKDIEKIKSIIISKNYFEAEEITPTSHLRNDLFLDSLDVVEIVMDVEKEFGIHIPDSAIEEMQSFADMCQIMHQQLQEQ